MQDFFHQQYDKPCVLLVTILEHHHHGILPNIFPYLPVDLGSIFLKKRETLANVVQGGSEFFNRMEMRGVWEGYETESLGNFEIS